MGCLGESTDGKKKVYPQITQVSQVKKNIYPQMNTDGHR
jgi:hypothetical protein